MNSLNAPCFLFRDSSTDSPAISWRIVFVGVHSNRPGGLNSNDSSVAIWDGRSRVQLYLLLFPVFPSESCPHLVSPWARTSILAGITATCGSLRNQSMCDHQSNQATNMCDSGLFDAGILIPPERTIPKPLLPRSRRRRAVCQLQTQGIWGAKVNVWLWRTISTQD